MTDAARMIDEFWGPFFEAFLEGTSDERDLLRILHQLSVERIGDQPRNAESMLRSLPLSNLQRKTKRVLRALMAAVREEAKFWGTGACRVDWNQAKRLREDVIRACNAVSSTIPIHEKREFARRAWSERADDWSQSAAEGVQHYMLGCGRDVLRTVICAMCLRMKIDPGPMLVRLDQEFNQLYEQVVRSANRTAVKAYGWIAAAAAGIELPPSPAPEEVKTAA